jgi:penicillin-binding protein 2
MGRHVFLFLVAAAPATAQLANSSLQTAVDRAMADRSGTAVVLNVGNRRVLAAYRLDVAAKRLVYPGSSLKPFTLLALLQARKLDAQTALFCKRPLTVGGHRLDCTHPDTHHPLDPASALAYSCNSYFISMATRLTPAQLRDSLTADGFPTVTGLAHNEAVGAISLATTPAQLQLQAIGEWGVLLTPLELLQGYLKLARLASQPPNPGLIPLFDGLEGSTSFGMGRLAQPEGAFKVAGKTGTAPSQEGPWTHAWFAGFAPAQHPEIVLVVFLEKGRGGVEAAEVARQIFAAYAALATSRPGTSAAGAQK